MKCKKCGDNYNDFNFVVFDKDGNCPRCQRGRFDWISIGLLVVFLFGFIYCIYKFIW
jgi:hypothetical protein